jgi:hypothetical protein
MIDWQSRADELLAEYNLCCRARPKHNAVNIQILKDVCGKWASHLATQRAWGTEVEIAEACHQLEPKLKELKEQVIIEILQYGSI